MAIIKVRLVEELEVDTIDCRDVLDYTDTGEPIFGPEPSIEDVKEMIKGDPFSFSDMSNPLTVEFPNV